MNADRPIFGYIYLTVNNVSGRGYIGQRKGNFVPSYCGGGVAIRAAIKSYGKKNFTVSIIEECYSQEELDEAEISHIAIMRAFGADLYNLAKGGKKTFGNSPSEETRAKISNKLKGRKGRPCPEHIKQKLRNDRIGIPLGPATAERRAKLSATLLGRKRPKLSDEWKINLAISLLRKNQSLVRNRTWEQKARRIISRFGGRLSDAQIAKINEACMASEEVSCVT
jgi:group I intron endonuclease